MRFAASTEFPKGLASFLLSQLAMFQRRANLQAKRGLPRTDLENLSGALSSLEHGPSHGPQWVRHQLLPSRLPRLSQ